MGLHTFLVLSLLFSPCLGEANPQPTAPLTDNRHSGMEGSISPSVHLERLGMLKKANLAITLRRSVSLLPILRTLKAQADLVQALNNTCHLHDARRSRPRDEADDLTFGGFTLLSTHAVPYETALELCLADARGLEVPDPTSPQELRAVATALLNFRGILMERGENIGRSLNGAFIVHNRFQQQKQYKWGGLQPSRPLFEKWYKGHHPYIQTETMEMALPSSWDKVNLEANCIFVCT